MGPYASGRLANPKSAIVSYDLKRNGVDGIDAGESGPLREPSDHRLYGFIGSLNFRLDRAIRRVPNPSREAEPFGLASRRHSIADALHPSGNPDMYAAYGGHESGATSH